MAAHKADAGSVAESIKDCVIGNGGRIRKGTQVVRVVVAVWLFLPRDCPRVQRQEMPASTSAAAATVEVISQDKEEEASEGLQLNIETGILVSKASVHFLDRFICIFNV